MGFLFLLMAFAALIAAVFGRPIAQKFLLSIAVVVMVCVGVCVFFVVCVIVEMNVSPPQTRSNSYAESYSPSATMPALNSIAPEPTSNTVTPPAVPDASTLYNNSPPPAYSANSAGGGIPKMGITWKPLSLAGQATFRNLGAPAGVGKGVDGVYSGSSAEAACLKTNDVVVSFDGHWMSNPQQLIDYEAQKGVGQPVRVRYFRLVNGQWIKYYLDIAPR